MESYTIYQINDDLPEAREARWSAFKGEVDLQTFKEAYHPVGRARAENLDELFEMMNLWQESPLWEAGGRSVTRRSNVPMKSLSCGDVVMVAKHGTTKHFVVAPLGFNLLESM